MWVLKLLAVPVLRLKLHRDPQIFIYYKDQGDNGDAVAVRNMVDSILKRYPSAQFKVAVIDRGFDADGPSPCLKVRGVLPVSDYPQVELVYAKSSWGVQDRSRSFLTSEDETKSSSQIVRRLSDGADLKLVLSTNPEQSHYALLEGSVWVMEYGTSSASNLINKFEACSSLVSDSPTLLSIGFGNGRSFYEVSRPERTDATVKSLCLDEGPVHRVYHHNSHNRVKSLFVAGQLLKSSESSEMTLFYGDSLHLNGYLMSEHQTGDSVWNTMLFDDEICLEKTIESFNLGKSFLDWAKENAISVELVLVSDSGEKKMSHIYGERDKSKKSLRLVVGRLSDQAYDSLRGVSSGVNFIDGDQGLAEAVSFEEVPIFGQNKPTLLKQLILSAEEHNKKALQKFFESQLVFCLSAFEKQTCFSGIVFDRRGFSKFLKKLSLAQTPLIQQQWQELCAIFRSSPSIGDRVCEILDKRLADQAV